MLNQNIASILSQGGRVHFIGAGGSGMYPLIQILLAKGLSISGSDVNEGSIIEYERKQGVRINIPHAAENVHGAALVVYSAAIPKENPERKEAVNLGIPCIERSVMLGYISSLYKHPLCIAGTHGKTTASGMAAQILETAKLSPAAVIGGFLPLIGGYGKPGKGDAIVIEACEYHNTFLQLSPEAAILLNVDDDHLEYFGSMDKLKCAFRTFCEKASDVVIYNADDENTREVIHGITVPLISFGINSHCNYKAINLHEYKPGFWAFTLCENGKELGEISLGAPGKHNVYNAVAACAGTIRLGATFGDITNALINFTGVGRRFEVLGVKNGITVVDDYAHHPTELKAALSSAKHMGYKQVWAIFQAYTFSRTQMLLDDFARVLQIADRVVLTPIMGGRELAENYSVTAADLAAKIPGATLVTTQREAADYILANASDGDLVITLGCGDIYKCAHMLVGDGLW